MPLGETCTQHPAYASLTQAQLAEPPYADPHVRWCGRGEQVTAPPIPIFGPREQNKNGGRNRRPILSGRSDLIAAAVVPPL